MQRAYTARLLRPR